MNFDFTPLFIAIFLLGMLACASLFGLGWFVVWIFHHLHWISSP